MPEKITIRRDELSHIEERSRKLAENELRKANEELEEQVTERTAEQLSTNERLQHELVEREWEEEALKRLSEVHEQRVKERTTELEINNEERKRVNKSTSGRELRTIELKEWIRELEERLL